MNKPRSKRSPFFLGFITVVVALIAAWGAAEIYARFFSATGYFTPDTIKARSLQYDPAVFARHVLSRKDATITDWLGTKTYYHINKQGYRGREFEFKKPPGTTRIIFYGGSSVFDLYSYDDDWPHRVESILRSVGFPEVEVINAGTPHHASFDAFGKLFAEGHLLDPDYVVLYDAWNDIKTFRSSEPLLRTLRPYDVDADPRMNYRNLFDRILCNASQIYVRLRHRYYDRKLGAGDEGKKPEGAFASEFGEIGPRQYRVSAAAFVDVARNIGAVPILMTEARLVSPDNTDEQKKRINYEYSLLTHEGLCKAFETCDEIIRSTAREKGVFLVDASLTFTGQDSVFKDHVHVTPNGSKQLAQFVADQLAPILREGGDPGASADGPGGLPSSAR